MLGKGNVRGIRTVDMVLFKMFPFDCHRIDLRIHHVMPSVCLVDIIKDTYAWYQVYHQQNRERDIRLGCMCYILQCNDKDSKNEKRLRQLYMGEHGYLAELKY